MKANQVLENVKDIIKEMDGIIPSPQTGRIVRKGSRRAVNLRKTYQELSVFDWWEDTVSKKQLKEMESFLKQAIKFGYTGHVEFKVGAKGCSHGMWAYRVENPHDNSDNPECLFHSFRPGDNYYSVKLDNGWIEAANGRPAELTLKELKSELK